VVELLSFLGLAWPRLLLYPGGLFALALLWAVRRARPAPPVSAPPELRVAACVPPLLLVCLLPLPGAAALPRALDLPAALALLEWPVALALLVGSKAPGDARALARRYGPLLLAACALAIGARSLALDGLVREPPSGALPRALIGAGAACWALALPALLDLGRSAGTSAERSGEALRVVGHGLLAATFWLALLPSPWLAPLPVALVFLLLFLADRGGDRGRSAWVFGSRIAAALTAGLILAAAAADVVRRLT
jgi:hypothetical protein